jgi:hypothetical protein
MRLPLVERVLQPLLMFSLFSFVHLQLCWCPVHKPLESALWNDGRKIEHTLRNNVVSAS